MMRNVGLSAVIVLVAGAAALGALESLRIVPIIHDDQVLISFQVPDGYNSEVREAIASGLRTTFSYDVELRMSVPGWVDRKIATLALGLSDQYDNLTRRHKLSRTVDGRVEESIVTEDEQVAARWLTTVNRLPLCKTSKLDASRDYYVRIDARVRPQRSLLGWANAITGQAKFTFIP